MPRTRRSAEETKAAILAAATPMLREGGPSGIRLDDVAAEVGVSRQAVLHHFGSRGGLLRAVAREAWVQLFAELQALADATEGMEPLHFVDRLDDTARRKGYARIGAWLLLSDEALPDSDFEGALAALGPAVHRSAPLDGSTSLEDSRYALLLVAATTFGDAIFGRRFRQLLGFEDTEAERQRFREWVTERLWATR